MDTGLNIFSKWSRITWFYIKYQCLTKGLFFLMISPISSSIFHILLKSTGRASISSGDFLGFILSFQGLGASFLLLMAMILFIGIDVNAFIIMSAIIYEEKGKVSARRLLIEGIKSLKAFLTPAGFLIILYIVIVIPLVGIGITISPMESFKIPNFITDVIFNNTVYTCIYIAILLALAYISTRYIFFLHYVLLMNCPIGKALANSSKLMKKNWKNFVWNFFIKGAGLIFIAFILIFAITLLFAITGNILIRDLNMKRAVLIFGMLITLETTILLSFMTVPVFCYRLTKLFYKYNENLNLSYAKNFNLDDNKNRLYRQNFNNRAKVIVP